MKKLLFSLAALLFVVSSYSQNTTEVQVVVKNYTNYNLFFAPRYNMGFYDGSNDYSFWGVLNTAAGTYSTAKDFDYQQEGQFEMVPPQTVIQYSNGGTYVGVPLLTNSVDPTFDTSGPVMVGYQNQPSWFLKIMKLSWIRFNITNSSTPGGGYGGALAYDFDPTGMTLYPTTSTPAYVDSNGEIFRTYGPSSTSFTVYGVTVYAQFITAPASGSTPATIHIVFYQ